MQVLVKEKAKVAISWSGGKDSAMVLNRLMNSEEYEVAGLMTTFLGDEREVNLHFIPQAIIQQQAKALGLPLFTVFLPAQPINEVYEKAHQNKVQQMHREEGINRIAFGDLYLQPIKEFRDRMLKPTGVAPIYPLWGSDTHTLLQEMEREPIKAIICAIDALKLPSRVLGQPLSEALLAPYAPNVDWCGENGEYHTLVYDGAGFRQAVSYSFSQEAASIDYRPDIEMAMEYLQFESPAR